MTTEISTEIIDILNKDPKAKQLIAILNEVAQKNNFTDKQYDDARTMILLMAIKNNPVAFKTLADGVYNQIRAEA